MANKRSGKKAKAAGKAGKRSTKEGFKLKDLDTKKGKQVRGGVSTGTGMSKGFYEWIKSS